MIGASPAMPVSLYLASSKESRRLKVRPKPWWLLAGAVWLAGLAGYINVIGLLGSYHVPVSHMSGAVARVSIDLVGGHHVESTIAALIVGCFLAGSVLCGALIGSHRLMPGRRYGIAMMIEGAALAYASWALARGGRGTAYGCAFACGMQNAMATSYCGLVIRTTHVTGIVTDIGILLGHWLRNRRREPWRLLFLASLLVAFFGGGVVGAGLWRVMGLYALWIAAATVGATGLVYFAWRMRAWARRVRKLERRRRARTPPPLR